MFDSAGVEGEEPFNQQASRRTQRFVWGPFGSSVSAWLVSPARTMHRATPVPGFGRGSCSFPSDSPGRRTDAVHPPFAGEAEAEGIRYRSR